jgi:hypothetical protein
MDRLVAMETFVRIIAAGAEFLRESLLLIRPDRLIMVW